MIFLKGYSIDLFKKFLEVFASKTDTGEMREIHSGGGTNFI